MTRDGTVYLSARSVILALDAASGAFVWASPTPLGARDLRIVSPPLAVDQPPSPQR